MIKRPFANKKCNIYKKYIILLSKYKIISIYLPKQEKYLYLTIDIFEQKSGFDINKLVFYYKKIVFKRKKQNKFN